MVAGALAAFATAGTAQASFIEEGSFGIAAGGPYDLVTADFNKDGRVDIATLNGDSNTVSVLLRGAGGGFALEGTPTGFGAGAGGGGYGASADFNGDGWPDVALGFLSDHASVLLRNPGGGFTLDPGSPRAQTPEVSSVAVGDFNADSRPDLVVLRAEGSFTILLRNSVGTDFLPPATFPGGGTDTRAAAVADLNGDGDADIVLSNTGSGTASVRYGGAGLSFNPGPNVSVGGQPFRVVVADFNADSRPDFAVAACDADAISMQIQQPGGGFSAAPAVPAGDCPIGLATGDFNFDGRPDLAAGNQASSNVTVALGNGDGSFRADEGSPVRTDAGATGVAVGDFDADTRPDLAVSGIGAHRVTVLLNRTPFPQGPPPPPGPVDADGDGVVAGQDCDDANPAIRPGARDIPGDGIDQNCDKRDARLPLLRRAISAVTATYPSGYLEFRTLSVRPVRKGDRIRLTCKGAGCKFKRKNIRVKKSAPRRSLMKHVRGMKLRKGAVLQLRVTRPGTIGRVKVVLARAPKVPKLKDRCVQPNKKKLIRCPRR
jgi:hypothetical protein